MTSNENKEFIGEIALEWLRDTLRDLESDRVQDGSYMDAVADLVNRFTGKAAEEAGYDPILGSVLKIFTSGTEER